MMKDSEKQIENAILKYLNLLPGCFAFKVNTMGVFDKTLGCYRRTSKYIVKGTADIFCIINIEGLGVMICLEVKSASGKQSDNQKQFQYFIERSKGFYFVVRSLQEAENAIRYARREIVSNLQNHLLRKTMPLQQEGLLY